MKDEIKIERRVYSGYAFTDNAILKSKMNHEIYEEIRGKAKLKCLGSSYASKHYEVISNEGKLTIPELALIADEGNLCFGYRVSENKIIISTD